MWSLVRTHMYVAGFLGSIRTPEALALSYFLRNDRAIPEDDIDNEGEWDDLASTHDTYLGALLKMRVLLRLSR
jgi:hypothetical protein